MIGYCTNVRAGEGLGALQEAVTAFARPLSALCADGVLPIGLWVSARSVRALARSGVAAELREAMHDAGARIASINAFPFGDFHEDVVKHRVYAPDWSLPQRADYTRACCLALHALLGEGERGGVSTLPIAWREGFGSAGIARAAAALQSIVPLLHELAERTGRTVHIDLEPEPGCVLDRPQDVVRFFDEYLLRGVDAPEERRIRHHVRVCHDVCHASVMFDAQRAALDTYAAAGIRLGRVQLSSAPSIDCAAGKAEAEEQVEALSRFAEPRWLHQSVIEREDGETEFFTDLPEAIARLRSSGGGVEGVRRVRTHLHVPVHLADLGAVQTTRGDVDEVLALLAHHRDAPVIEVETYAWSALPEDVRGASMLDSAHAELLYCRGVLRDAQRAEAERSRDAQ